MFAFLPSRCIAKISKWPDAPFTSKEKLIVTPDRMVPKGIFMMAFGIVIDDAGLEIGAGGDSMFEADGTVPQLLHALQNETLPITLTLA
jgi:hypothetical protein